MSVIQESEKTVAAREAYYKANEIYKEAIARVCEAELLLVEAIAEDHGLIKGETILISESNGREYVFDHAYDLYSWRAGWRGSLAATEVKGGVIVGKTAFNESDVLRIKK